MSCLFLLGLLALSTADPLGLFSLTALDTSEFLDLTDEFLIANNTIQSSALLGAGAITIQRVVKQLHLQVLWQNLTSAPVECFVTVLIEDQTMLENAQLDQPRLTLDSSAPQNLTIAFTSIDFGSTNILIVIQLHDIGGWSQEVYALQLIKLTTVRSCDGLCVMGTCNVDQCICDIGWDHTWDCSTKFLTPSAICTGDTFEISWNHTDAVALDWISIDWPNDIGEAYTVEELEEFNPMLLWSYASPFWRQNSDGTEDPSPVGTFTWSLWDGTIPGIYSVVYWYDDGYDVIAHTTIRLLPMSDPRCNPINDTTCVNGDWNTTTSSCDCYQPTFFGEHCDHGCADLTISESFGTDFSSSTGTLEYINDMQCQWLISPKLENLPDIASVDEIIITFTDFGIEPNDMVQIFQGREMNDSLLFGDPITGEYVDPLEFRVQASEVLVVFTTNGNTASTPGTGIRGFRANYRVAGCPPGNFVDYNSTTGLHSCTRCPTGQFSALSDTIGSCDPCSHISQSEVQQLSTTQRTRYQQNCLPPIAMWRVNLAIFILAFSSLLLLAAMILLPLRRTKYPVASRSISMMAALIVAFGITLMIPISDYDFDSFSCKGLFWLASLRLHLIVLPVLVSIYRLKVLKDFQALRREMENDLALAYSTKVVARFQKAALKSKRWLNDWNLLGLYLISLIPIVLIGGLNWSTEYENFTTTDKGCIETVRLQTTELVFALLYIMIFAAGLQQIKAAKVAFGIKRELSVFLPILIFYCLIYYGSVLSVPHDTILISWDLRYFVWLFALSYFTIGVLIPCLRTFGFLMPAPVNRKAKDLTLQELLATPRGVKAFMEYCRRELSEENVMFYLDI